ncbi:MAG: c-type cytochrome [Syntrophobacterales bacterium]|jgi:uncharacterized membrane protein|nr:c-type cytochrome [Syntrophobacterales bacterium]
MTVFNPIYNALYAIGYSDPLHPSVTHIPIGLVVAALVFGLAGLLLKRPLLGLSARHCLVLAWLFIFPTVLLGFMDWQHFYQGAWLVPIIVKITLASCLFVLLSIGLIFVFAGREESRALLGIFLIAFFIVVGLGYFGGRLVFGGRAPYAPANLQPGKRLFENNCMACHPNGGNAIVAEYLLNGSDNLVDFDKFRAFIRNPRLDNGSRGPMPVFSTEKLPDAEARVLYDYVKYEFGKAVKP